MGAQSAEAQSPECKVYRPLETKHEGAKYREVQYGSAKY